MLVDDARPQIKGFRVLLQPKFNIIIVTHNSEKFLPKTIDALERQDCKDFVITIVDNNSKKDVGLCLPKFSGEISILYSSENRGFGEANNLGVKSHHTDWVIMLNPDACPLPDWLSNIVQAQKRYPSIEVFGSTQLNMEDPNLIDGFGDSCSIFGIAWQNHKNELANKLPTDDKFVFSACGAASIFKRTLFLVSDGYAGHFFCYLEDVDLGWRLQRMGKSCLQIRNAVVLHYGSHIHGSDSDFAIFYTFRNRALMLRRNLPFLLFVFLALTGNLMMSPTIIFRYSWSGKISALKGIIVGLRLALKEKQIHPDFLLNDFARLFMQGAFVISPIKISKKTRQEQKNFTP